MANKVVAAFLLCIVIAAALNVGQVSAGDPGAAANTDVYKNCFNQCMGPCKEKSGGETYCEMKCDDECDAVELKAKLDEVGKKGSA